MSISHHLPSPSQTLTRRGKPNLSRRREWICWHRPLGDPLRRAGPTRAQRGRGPRRPAGGTRTPPDRGAAGPRGRLQPSGRRGAGLGRPPGRGLRSPVPFSHGPEPGRPAGAPGADPEPGARPLPPSDLRPDDPPGAARSPRRWVLPLPVDPNWRTPHFEKMLYDQALLVPLLLRAADVLNEPRYRFAARETLDFLLAQTRTPDGAFIASFSAVDGAGEEGGYYLWRTEDLAGLLTPEALPLAVRAWGLGGAPDHAAGSLPVMAADPAQAAADLGLDPQIAAQLLDQAKAALLAERAARTLPADTKVLAAWNGLTLSALVAGARAFPGGPYLGGPGPAGLPGGRALGWGRPASGALGAGLDRGSDPGGLCLCRARTAGLGGSRGIRFRPRPGMAAGGPCLGALPWRHRLAAVRRPGAPSSPCGDCPLRTARCHQPRRSSSS